MLKLQDSKESSEQYGPKLRPLGQSASELREQAPIQHQ